jgi:hypothetical protein
MHTSKADLLSTAADMQTYIFSSEEIQICFKNLKMNADWDFEILVRIYQNALCHKSDCLMNIRHSLYNDYITVRATCSGTRTLTYTSM